MMSISSILLSNTTMFRNPNGPEQDWVHDLHRKPPSCMNVAIAEVAYLTIIPLAIIETALYCIALALTIVIPDNDLKTLIEHKFYSSAFSIIWATTDAILNFCMNDLIVTEKVARACAASGNPFAVPMFAL